MQTPNTNQENASDRVRLQVDMTKERLAGIDKLVTLTGMASRKELLDNALTLIAWAIRESRSGNAIVSMDLSNQTFRELAMPCLDFANQNELTKTT